jgi:hypothetical protein
MQTYYAQIIGDTGLPGAPAGAILPIERFERLGQMVDGPLARIIVMIDGQLISLWPHHVMILDPAAAKRLRSQRKRAADHAAPSWRGPAGS